MEIAKKKLSELKPAPYNPRKIDKETLEKLKQSIQNFGYVEPLVWNKRTGHVVGGNQRLRVLKELGMDEVDVVIVDLSLEEEKALNLALNKIEGSWDLEKLEEVLGSIPNDLFSLTGFTNEEIEEILKQVDVNEFFEAEPREPVSHTRKYKCPRCGAVFTADGQIVEVEDE